MATQKHVLFLGVGAVGALSSALWMAACGTGSGGTGQVADAAQDVNEASTADGAGEGSTAESGADAGVDARADASSDAPSDVLAEGDGNDGGAGCNVTNCGGACCGDKCVSSCTGCAEGTSFCPFSTTVPNSNGKCITACAACDSPGFADGGVTCFSCAGGTPPIMCEPTLAECATSASLGACSCASGDAGSCPGAMQVCSAPDAAAPMTCLSCGQEGTDGLSCGNGKTCHQASSTCQ